MTDPLLQLKDVGVRFRLHFERAFTLKEVFINTVRRKNGYRDLWALKGINLDIKAGEAVGIIGRNGSGKSTLLKVIAGVFEPTVGTRTVNGTVAALIELGAGFNGELTGRENVFLNGAIMGRTKAEMLSRYERIVEFAGLKDFMDTPVKNYSSGMYARLGFAIATDVDADILLIDEILGVGDEAFQKKSVARIEAHLAAGKTVVFVSHDAGSIQKICSRAVLLHNGEPSFDGNTTDAIAEYRRQQAAETHA
ncbi:MAG: ABC transporter ATP-binding protein [Deltaproteobacteria bacterium]|nr:ABC transporter ATP-binding protein [Deltaproteobacteria bacterium]